MRIIFATQSGVTTLTTLTRIDFQEFATRVSLTTTLTRGFLLWTKGG